MTLPHDYCRCHDYDCPERLDCLRFLLRDTGHDRTPHAYTLYYTLPGGQVDDDLYRTSRERNLPCPAQIPPEEAK